MSTWFDEEVRCPDCHAPFTARLAHGVHVSRAPEVRDMLFARTFHRLTCPHCAATFTAQRPLVYTDMDRKHWLQVMPPVERPRWPELEQLTDDVFERAFIGSPLAADLRDGFKRRLVFGLEELREKLVIWRARSTMPSSSASRSRRSRTTWISRARRSSSTRSSMERCGSRSMARA